MEIEITARDILKAILRDWANNYLTVERFAEAHAITTDQAKALIELARDVENSPHPES